LHKQQNISIKKKLFGALVDRSMRQMVVSTDGRSAWLMYYNIIPITHTKYDKSLSIYHHHNNQYMSNDFFLD